MNFDQAPKSIIEEKLTEEENRVLEIGISLQKAMKEEKEATKDQLERGTFEQDDGYYVNKWKNLYEQFHTELKKIPESNEKIMEKLESETKRLGLAKNHYTGEYMKPTKK